MSESQPGRLYTEILFDMLRIASGFFEADDNLAAFRDKLSRAAEAMRGSLTEFVGINICLHLGSSAVLIASQDEELKKTLRWIEASMPGIDATTVVTIAALYHILMKLHERNDLPDAEKRNLEYLCTRFRDINWLLGLDRMRQLGID